MGGVNGGAGEDFWTELSNTNSLLSQLQEQIQAVRTAHQTSLVSVNSAGTNLPILTGLVHG